MGLLHSESLVNCISCGLGVSLPLSTILVNRGYDTIEKACSFVDGKSFDGYLQDLKKWNAIAKMVKMGFPVKDNLSKFADKSAEQIYEEYEGYLNHIFANVDTEIKTYNPLEGLHELIDSMDKGEDVGGL